MAGNLNRFTVHGAFDKKADAKREERKVKGSFILKRKIEGRTRFLVLKPKARFL
jgi:hypothetical protein